MTVADRQKMVAALEVVSFSAREQIVKQGDQGDAMFFIEAGG